MFLKLWKETGAPKGNPHRHGGEPANPTQNESTEHKQFLLVTLVTFNIYIYIIDYKCIFLKHHYLKNHDNTTSKQPQFKPY